jgi:acyl-CoA reductase-like NAD-dependent aldehyde dehydrogenase
VISCPERTTALSGCWIRAHAENRGTAVGVWTANMPRALRMTKALKVGTVWVNTYRTYSYMVPFGGTKRSGLGRENGIEAINEYLETKSVYISIADRPPPNVFIMR